MTDHAIPLAALGQIIGANLLLSGDNALVIAMVTRNLAPADRRTGILAGTAGAVVMRILLTLGVWRLLEVPGLRLAGGLTLLWMAWRMAAQGAPQLSAGAPPARLRDAIRQVMWADLVMSADNVLAVAAAAHGHLGLLLAGIATSLPLVALGSGLLGRLLDRLPVLHAAGAALLGWVAGGLVDGDPALDAWPEWLQAALAPAAALALGWTALRALRRGHAAPATEQA